MACYKNWKKVTTILDVKFQATEELEIEGLLIADKVGEQYFLNLNNLEKLPKNNEAAPNHKEGDADNKNHIAKLLYGHQ